MGENNTLLVAEFTADLYMHKDEAWFCGSPQTRCLLNLAELPGEQGQGNFRLKFTEHPQNEMLCSARKAECRHALGKTIEKSIGHAKFIYFLGDFSLETE